MSRPSTRTLVLVGLGVSLLLVTVVSAWASASPDGLERVAHDLGLAAPDDGRAPVLSGAVGRAVGVLVVAVIAFGLTAALRRRASRRDSS